MKLQHTLLSLFVIGALSACGGSYSSDDTYTALTTSVTGKAADGYLSNAKVCLDLNSNKMCDSDEPSTITGEGGTFTLTGVTRAQIDANPLLVEIIAGETIDEDEPGVVLTQGYTLSAPAGYTFVSPLTTLVQNEVDNGSSVNEAEVAVQGKLGTTLSLNEDYIAGTETGEDADEFKKLHQIAQVTANIIANNIALLEETADAANIDLDDLISLIINEIFDALDEITVQVKLAEADDNITFDADSIATTIDDELIAIEQDTLVDQVAQNEAENASTTSNLAELIKNGGINWFWSEREDGYVALGFGHLSVDSDDVFTDIEYEINAEGIAEEREYDPETDLVLTSEGWIIGDDTITNITLNADQSITLVMTTTALNETVTGTELILDGLNVKTALMHTGGDGSWAGTVDSSLIFPDGSIAYQLSFEQTMSTLYSLNFYGSCDTKVSTNPEDNCNGVWIANTPVQDLESLIVSDSSDDINDSAFRVINVSNGHIFAEVVTGGVVHFYNRNSEADTTVQLSSGTWQDITVHGKTLRAINAPASVVNMDNNAWSDFEDSNTLYLTVVEGYVRKLSADDDFGDDGEYVFNTIAAEYILANADRDNLAGDTFTETLKAIDDTTETREFTKQNLL